MSIVLAIRATGGSGSLIANLMFGIPNKSILVPLLYWLVIPSPMTTMINCFDAPNRVSTGPILV